MISSTQKIILGKNRSPRNVIYKEVSFDDDETIDIGQQPITFKFAQYDILNPVVDLYYNANDTETTPPLAANYAKIETRIINDEFYRGEIISEIRYYFVNNISCVNAYGENNNVKAIYRLQLEEDVLMTFGRYSYIADSYGILSTDQTVAYTNSPNARTSPLNWKSEYSDNRFPRSAIPTKTSFDISQYVGQGVSGRKLLLSGKYYEPKTWYGLTKEDLINEDDEDGLYQTVRTIIALKANRIVYSRSGVAMKITNSFGNIYIACTLKNAAHILDAIMLAIGQDTSSASRNITDYIADIYSFPFDLSYSTPASYGLAKIEFLNGKEVSITGDGNNNVIFPIRQPIVDLLFPITYTGLGDNDRTLIFKKTSPYKNVYIDFMPFGQYLQIPSSIIANIEPLGSSATGGTTHGSLICRVNLLTGSANLYAAENSKLKIETTEIGANSPFLDKEFPVNGELIAQANISYHMPYGANIFDSMKYFNGFTSAISSAASGALTLASGNPTGAISGVFGFTGGLLQASAAYHNQSGGGTTQGNETPKYITMIDETFKTPQALWDTYGYPYFRDCNLSSLVYFGTDENPFNTYIQTHQRRYLHYSYSHPNGHYFVSAIKEEDDKIEELLLQGVFVTKYSR